MELSPCQFGACWTPVTHGVRNTEAMHGDGLSDAGCLVGSARLGDWSFGLLPIGRAHPWSSAAAPARRRTGAG